MMQMTAVKYPLVSAGKVEQEIYDVCIIGAGVAGSALAGYLGKHGLKVAIIEKDWSEQDRIVGELLQPDGVEKLRKMGMEHVLEGFDAIPINGYAIFMNERHIQVGYPSRKDASSVGRGLRNGKFVQKMRDYLAMFPNISMIEGTVNGLHQDEQEVHGVNFTADGEEHILQANLTVICDGFFSKMRQDLNEAKAEVTGFFLGIVLKRAELPFPNHGHVIVTDQMPFLAYPISSEEIRVLIDFPGKQPPRKGPELDKFLRENLLPRIPESMRTAFIAAIEEGKFKVMPNHRLPAKPLLKNGGVLLGDSLNMRHPLTGGGMTVALSDTYALGSLVLGFRDLSDKEKVMDAITTYYTESRKPNASINILADALYGVFKNRDLGKACFEYLEKGGKLAQGPVAILSGISRDTNLLNIHFFSVALYGAGKVLLPFPTPSRIGRAYRMVGDALHIIAPLIENEQTSTSLKMALKAGKFIFPVRWFYRN